MIEFRIVFLSMTSKNKDVNLFNLHGTIHTDKLTIHFTFLKKRSAISPNKLARELVLDSMNLQKIMVALQNIPKSRQGDFKDITTSPLPLNLIIRKESNDRRNLSKREI